MTEQGPDPEMVESLKPFISDDLPPPPPSTNGHFKDDQSWTEETEHYTDLRLAHRLVAIHGDDIRYCHPWNTWLIWNGQRWARDDKGHIDTLTQEVVMGLYQEAATAFVKSTDARGAGDTDTAKTHHSRAEALYKWAEKSESAPRLAAAEKIARNQKTITVLPNLLDADPWLLNVTNGTIDLHTGELKPHDKTQMLTKMAPVEYDPVSNLELWPRFLAEAIPDEETREYVQRCVGATAVGKADDDMLLICHGQGGTGKGTFLNSIQRTLGDYAAAAELSTFTTARDAHGPQPDLARLQGRRMVAISEVDSGGAMALLKRATGGDPIITRSHHQETFEFLPQFTIWIICNERPNVPHNDTGAWRRIRDIPFDVKFAKPDTTIRPTLTNPEKAGSTILNWVIAGCLAWQKEGVGMLPGRVWEATEEYKAEMDPLGDWLEDTAVEDTEYWMPGKVLWESYRNWAKDNNIRRSLGRKKFSQQLNEKYEEKRLHGGTRGFLGLYLTDPSGDTSEVSPTPKISKFAVCLRNLLSWRENQEISVLSVPPQIQTSFENSTSEVSPQIGQLPKQSDLEINEVSPQCAICGGDDLRYSSGGELECIVCQPE